LSEIAGAVRHASLSGDLVELGAVWQGTEAEFLGLFSESRGLGFVDLVLIKEGKRAFLYSENYMSRQYAEAAGRAASANTLELIAEAVRYDSTTYPRPTPSDTFACKPYGLSAAATATALAEMSCDPRYADIKLTRASNGSLFLFSSDRLSPSHAASLAEWLAVGQFENP
jgi:hypothetical protein